VEQVLHAAHAGDARRDAAEARDVLIPFDDPAQEHCAVLGVDVDLPFETRARRKSSLSTLCASATSSAGGLGAWRAFSVRRTMPTVRDSARRARITARRSPRRSLERTRSRAE